MFDPLFFDALYFTAPYWDGTDGGAAPVSVPRCDDFVPIWG